MARLRASSRDRRAVEPPPWLLRFEPAGWVDEREPLPGVTEADRPLSGLLDGRARWKAAGVAWLAEALDLGEREAAQRWYALVHRPDVTA